MGFLKKIEAHEDVKEGDLVISFHSDPTLPSFIIGKIVGTKQWEDGTTRYELKAMFDVNTRGEIEVFQDEKTYYPPVNGTPSTGGGNHGLGHGIMNHVKKIKKLG